MAGWKLNPQTTSQSLVPMPYRQHHHDKLASVQENLHMVPILLWIWIFG